MQTHPPDASMKGELEAPAATRPAKRLIPHPAHPPLWVRFVEARIIGSAGRWLQLRWRIEGAERLVVPLFAGKGRADGLWRTTCFELFLRPEGGTAYAEFNLSPSERWAAYDFDAPRQNMRERPMPRDASCTLRRGGSVAIFDAAIPLAALPQGPCAMALTAVIEEAAEDGRGGGEGQPGEARKSYWALAHPPGAPDFHDPACFTATLPAPDRP